MKYFDFVWVFITVSLLLLSATARNNSDQIFLLWAFYSTSAGFFISMAIRYRRTVPSTLSHWLRLVAAPFCITVASGLAIAYLFFRDFGEGIG